jgi:hypothetical protein
MSDIAKKIWDRIGEIEDVAEQATSEGIATWTPEDPSFWFDDEHPMARHERLLIAMHDPASVLRRCAADREIVAEVMSWKHYYCEDSWYSCGLASEGDGEPGSGCANDDDLGRCTCDLDGRRLKILGPLACGYGLEVTV